VEKRGEGGKIVGGEILLWKKNTYHRNLCRGRNELGVSWDGFSKTRGTEKTEGKEVFQGRSEWSRRRKKELRGNSPLWTCSKKVIRKRGSRGRRAS